MVVAVEIIDLPKSSELCEHAPAVPVAPRSSACEECGSTFNMRSCLTCGHVGCCESQAGHARDHAHSAQHRCDGAGHRQWQRVCLVLRGKPLRSLTISRHLGPWWPRLLICRQMVTRKRSAHRRGCGDARRLGRDRSPLGARRPTDHRSDRRRPARGPDVGGSAPAGRAPQRSRRSADRGPVGAQSLCRGRHPHREGSRRRRRRGAWPDRIDWSA